MAQATYDGPTKTLTIVLTAGEDTVLRRAIRTEGAASVKEHFEGFLRQLDRKFFTRDKDLITKALDNATETQRANALTQLGVTPE